MRLVLASASPRRTELLKQAGLTFVVHPAEVDEGRLPGEPPAAFVERVALLKARTVSAEHPSATVLGADTAVVLGDEVFGKPRDEGDAARMLRALSGRSHAVMTGVALVAAGWTLTRVETTTVWFSQLSPEDIAGYVSSGEPMDKAGAYAIQGLASRFIPRIEGSYTNVVGLPVAAVVEMMKAAPDRPGALRT